MSHWPTTARRRRTVASAVRGDRGAWSVEVAGFFLPCMLVAIVVVAAAFQLAISRLDLESASAAAARAASLQRSPTAATAAARQAAENDLAGRSITCAKLVVAVDTSRWQRGGSVTVTVTCTVDLSTLAMMNAIPGQMTASSTSTAPIDTYRSVALGTDSPRHLDPAIVTVDWWQLLDERQADTPSATDAVVCAARARIVGGYDLPWLDTDPDGPPTDRAGPQQWEGQ